MILSPLRVLFILKDEKIVRILALDSSTPALVCGVVEKKGSNISLLADASLENTRDHNELFVPTIHSLLEKAQCSFSDLDAVVVGQGPGPFTGLRVGMATAFAIADALEIPIFGVCSLDAIAHHICRKEDGFSSLLVATDAKRREIYWSRYRIEHKDSHRIPVCIEGPAVHSPDHVDMDADCINMPVLRNQPDLTGKRVVDYCPDPLSLVEAAGSMEEQKPITALYLRRPDAVEPKNIKRVGQ